LSEHSPKTTGNGNGNGNGIVEAVLPGETVTARAAHASLKGHRKGLARLWPFLGPAFIAAVAYVDPGNFATNIAGGRATGICSCG
jgi:manganese transport protein